MKKKLLFTFPLLALIVSVAAVTAAADCGEIHIRDAWVREAPPTAKVMAAYMTILNESKEILVITGAKSPDFEKAMFHKTSFHGDEAHMTHIKKIEIAAGSTLELKPGGHHLMLRAPKKRLRAGDMVGITINFRDGLQKTIRVEVKKGRGR